MNTFQLLDSLLRERILVLDGAMGTMIQQHKLDEAAFKGTRFADHSQDLQGNNDLLILTQPHIIEGIHREYLEAGADIIETNTFSANSISQGDYGLKSIVYELNMEGAKLARRAADDFTRRNPAKPRFVAGAMGPTTRSLSTPFDPNDPAARTVTFDEMVAVFAEQVRGLMDGGVDLLLPETSIDTLVMKAMLFAIQEQFERMGQRVPVIASNAIFDNSGRTLSGQTLEAFWTSISHAPLFGVGLNCGMAPHDLRSYVEEFSRLAPIYTHAYFNAGLPNAMGEYDWTPEQFVDVMGDYARNGWLNIIGGCCGTTPTHIKALAEAVERITTSHTAPNRAAFTFFGRDQHYEYISNPRFFAPRTHFSP